MQVSDNSPQHVMTTLSPLNVPLNVLADGALAGTLAGLRDISSGEAVRELCEQVKVNVRGHRGLAQAGAEDLQGINGKKGMENDISTCRVVGLCQENWFHSQINTQETGYISLMGSCHYLPKENSPMRGGQDWVGKPPKIGNKLKENPHG